MDGRNDILGMYVRQKCKVPDVYPEQIEEPWGIG